MEKRITKNAEWGGFTVNNTMRYKGYVGSVEFSENDSVFYGKVLGIRSLISYEGANAKDLVSDFHEAVDDYLALCKEDGVSPEVAYKGSFNVRISPQLHEQLAVYAQNQGISMNKLVENALQSYQPVHTV